MENTGRGVVAATVTAGRSNDSQEQILSAVRAKHCPEGRGAVWLRKVPDGRIAGTAVRPPTQWKYLDGVPVFRVVGR